MMDISIPYYEDMSRISNSNIGWFLNKGPAFLRAKLDGKIEDESTTALERGTMIHMYLLQPEEFLNTYKLCKGAKPKSVNQEKFVQTLINSAEIDPDKAALEAFKSAYSTTGRSSYETLSKARQMALELNEYITDVRSGKKLITEYDLWLLNKIRDNIGQHKVASKLLKPTFTIYDTKTPEDESKVLLGKTKDLPIAEALYHEFHINWEYNGLKCKSLLDSLHLDFKNKVFTIMDIKTTAKIYHFEDSMKEYDYLRQLYYYRMAVEWYLENELGEDPSKWDKRYFIIAIDTVEKNHDVRVFNITAPQFEKNCTKDRICFALDDIKWHFETGLWEHSREYYMGNGCETLSL
jgi:hypothetical protein